MKTRRIAGMALVCGIMLAAAGCSAGGAARTGFTMFKNSNRTDSYLKIMLDDKPATQDALKKTTTGYSRFDITDPVSTSPTLKFEIIEPDRFGRITMVSLSIHQKFEADYSDHAEFTVVARKLNEPEAQMKPNTEYKLGDPGEDFKVSNYKGEEVKGVELKPGMSYMLTLTVKADKSETAQIYFTTK